MFGIVVIVATQHISNSACLALGRDAIMHHGPDDAGEWWSVDGRVELAQRRLAIVDLSTAALL